MLDQSRIIKVFLSGGLPPEALSALEADSRIQIAKSCCSNIDLVQQILNSDADVVVLDVADDFESLNACREISQQCVNAAILILTTRTDARFVRRAIEYGAAGSLLKTAGTTTLARAIEIVACGEFFLGFELWHQAIAPATQPGMPKQLTTRERQVLQMIAEGKTNRQIACDLRLAPKTIDTHRSRLMKKLGLHDVTAVVKYAIKNGLIRLD